MRILQVVPRFSPEHGGGGVVIARSLARELDKRGHEVTVYTSDFEYDATYGIRYMKSCEVAFYLSHSVLNIASLHITPYTLGNLGEVISGFDIIHMQGCRTFQNIVVRRYAKRYGIPYIVDAHGFPVEGTFLRRLFIKVFDALFAKRIVRGAAFCVAESQVGVEEYKRAGVDESKIVVIPCPYDLSVFDSLPRRGRFKKRWNIPKESKICLFLGNLDYIKGIDFLIKSFAKLQRDDAWLVIVGPDTESKYGKSLWRLVEELKLERVFFTNGLYGTDKLEALVGADVAVFPSRAEQGLPFAGLEAIMCNTPVIVAGDTGAAEDIKRMEGGYIVGFGDERMLARRIAYVFEEWRFAKTMVQKAQAYIKENLSMGKRVKDYENLYKRCLK